MPRSYQTPPTDPAAKAADNAQKAAAAKKAAASKASKQNQPVVRVRGHQEGPTKSQQKPQPKPTVSGQRQKTL